jgi:hypothetical protein
MSERGEIDSVGLIKDVLGLLGGASVVVSGAAALFATAYLAGLQPISRLLNWDERVAVAMISVIWQVGLIGVIAVILLGVRLFLSRGRQRMALATVVIGNLAAGAMVLFGLNSYEEPLLCDLRVVGVVALAAVGMSGLYIVIRWLNPDSFQASARLLLAGFVAGVVWVSASGFSKVQHDLHREAVHLVSVGGAPVGTLSADPRHCVTLILANARMLAYADGGKAVYQERGKSGAVLTTEPCPPTPRATSPRTAP